jgi:hypothetical protein
MPPALRQALATLCLEAAQTLYVPILENHAPRDRGRLPFLLAQAQALAPSAELLPPEDLLRSLAAATLGALEVATGREDAGFRRYGQAAKAMGLQWRARKAAQGATSLALLPDLDHLATLQALAGLRKAPWRDEALRIRCAASRGPDPGLEQGLAEAVEDHYGPWLTPVELEPTLEFCGLLARQWQREPDDRTFTRRLAKVGMKDGAELVWRLVARKGPEGMRSELQALLGRLDAATLLEEDAASAGALKVAEALRATPLQRDSDRLLNRLDTLLGKAGPSRLGLRRRIARIREDADAEAAFLAEEVGFEKDPAALRGLLKEAADLLEHTPAEALVKAGTPRILALARAPGTRDEATRDLLGAWNRILRQAGDPAAATELAASLAPEREAVIPPPAAEPDAPEAPAPPQPREEAAATRASALRPAVDDILNFAKGGRDPQEATLRLEAILPKVEEARDPDLQAECLGTLAWVQSQEGKDTEMEATFLAMLRLLEENPDLKGDTREAPLLYLVHLWRAQRLDDVIARMRRWETLLRRDPRNEGLEELAKYGPLFERMARFQGLLRTAGLQ